MGKPDGDISHYMLASLKPLERVVEYKLPCVPGTHLFILYVEAVDESNEASTFRMRNEANLLSEEKPYDLNKPN